MKTIKNIKIDCSLMKKLLLLSLLAFFGCQKKHPSLDFFEVRLVDVQTPSLGTVALTAKASGESGVPPLEQFGFVFFSGLSEAQLADKLPLDTSKIILAKEAALPASGLFSGEKKLNPADELFFRAFGRVGERVVFSAEIKKAALPQFLEMIGGQITVTNDEGFPQAFFKGLAALGEKIMAHGHVFSETNPDPRIGAFDCTAKDLGEATADGLFQSTCQLEFNSEYWVRAYAQAASGRIFYSAGIEKIKTRGGWRRVADFPMKYQGGSAVNGFAGFGANTIWTGGAGNYLRDTWRFVPPTPDNRNGEWQSVAPYPYIYAGVWVDPKSHGSTFVIGDTLYVVCGGHQSINTIIPNNQFIKYCISKNTWSMVTPSYPTPRMDAVSFVWDGKGYVGCGWNPTDGDLNDFYEYNPTNGRWRRVADLGTQQVPQGYTGRRSAIVLANSRAIWVGGGYTGSSNGSLSNAFFLSDIQVFTPPSSPTDSGKWALSTFFPNASSIGYVAAFTCDDRMFLKLSSNQLWELDQSKPGGWFRREDFPGTPRNWAMSFSMNGIGFIGTGEVPNTLLPPGQSGDPVVNDFWMYVPEKL